MSLENGGHLTHGSPVNFSGKIYNMIFYGVDSNGYIDYDDLKNKIISNSPQLILAGASAYSREIDFNRIREIIESVRVTYLLEHKISYNPYFMVDMAHIAGLVATGLHQSPFGYADIITTTTHKTLRGPRGGLIFCKPELASKIDGAVFPGSQGGPLQHVIAAKAVAAEEACDRSFYEYMEDVTENCWTMCNHFVSLGYDVVTGGTDNHLFLIDLSRTHPHVTGKMVQDELDKIGITLNKNMVPGDKRKPSETSGIRIGTAAMTTKGWKPLHFIDCANTISDVINKIEERIVIDNVQ